MLELGVRKGFRRTSDWLVIPLAPRYHSDGGPTAIDGSMGVPAWEARFGTQVRHLDAVSREIGYNVWLKAGIDRQLEGLC